MTSIYMINDEGRCTGVVQGDTDTIKLNIPTGVTFTLLVPQDMFDQRFDVMSQSWYYPEVEEEAAEPAADEPPE